MLFLTRQDLKKAAAERSLISKALWNRKSPDAQFDLKAMKLEYELHLGCKLDVEVISDTLVKRLK